MEIGKKSEQIAVLQSGWNWLSIQYIPMSPSVSQEGVAIICDMYDTHGSCKKFI